MTIVGLSSTDMVRTLGEPTQRVERNPGEVWTYRTPGCAVEILFLLDVVRNALFAVDSKIAGTDGTARAEHQCLQRIRTGRGT